jgi:hypothetical protein
VPNTTAWLQVEGPRNPQMIARVPGDSVSSVKLFVAAHQQDIEPGSTDIAIVVKDLTSGLVERQETSFKGPK